MMLLQMNELSYTFNDSINYYSVIHFIEYIILSLIPFVKFVHVAILSVFWETIELFIDQEWAKESGGNKLFDIFFNFSGFTFGKTLLKIERKKKSISP